MTSRPNCVFPDAMSKYAVRKSCHVLKHLTLSINSMMLVYISVVIQILSITYNCYMVGVTSCDRND